MNYKIDNLQYCKWNREVFKINREAELDAVHVTVVYHEDYDEFLKRIEEWKNHFKENSDLIFHGKNYKDIEKANKENKTAIFFGFQNCSPIEDNIDLVEKIHEHGCRFMQLTYNNQSLLATGCYEKNDSGVTNFGREVIKEMNRVGIVIDMSHSAEKSTFDAIDISEKPIAITHANPFFWHSAKRNKSNELLKVLSESKHEIISVYTDPGLDFATVRARPLAQMASTRHVMLVFPQDQQSIVPIEAEGEIRSSIEESPMNQSTEIQSQQTN